jgi:serine/threonine-protein kinase
MSQRSNTDRDPAPADRELVTLVVPEPEAPRISKRTPASFPTDILELARGRIRVLAAFFAVAFAFDPIVYVTAVSMMRHVPREAVHSLANQLTFAVMSLVSIGLWFLAGHRRMTMKKLYKIVLEYQVVLCFIVATSMYSQFYADRGVIALMTWVPPIVIAFPLIVPGPPRAMAIAAIVSGAMAPIGLWWIDLTGRVHVTDPIAYVQAVISSGFAVVLAIIGSRVIYGMGKEVARARALGSYQLEERLGEGGMGEVWRARHRLLARTAAVKLIRPALSAGVAVSGTARQRFEREAQAIAQLRSPHTVNLFDYGVAADGSFYYAMELLEGLDVESLVRRFGPVSPERAVFILNQICHSLSEAESVGLVHRDIKPSNIFLCRYGEDLDFVKVLDFGIVKSSFDGPNAATALTGENVIHGTPAFMAPEQALGSANVDGRADIYSLGCVAYWLLTGQLVFNADSPTGMLMKHIQSEPSAPSSRAEVFIPPSFDTLVLACLAKEPAARPQSARELSRLLAEIESSTEWGEEQRRQWWEKNLPEAERFAKQTRA